MLSSAFKNSIIMLMIILLFHFLIKNYLYDKGVYKSTVLHDTHDKESNKNNENIKKENFRTTVPLSEDFDFPLQKQKPIEPDFSINPNEKDVMRFVLGDDEDEKIDVPEPKQPQTNVDGLLPANVDGFAYLDEAFKTINN